MPYQYASSVIPVNINPSITPMTIKVLAAFFSAGALKFGMALDTASTPVSAEQPELKAFNSRNKLTLETAEPISGTFACTPPAAYLIIPEIINTTIDTTNKYTGIAMNDADSVTPRRLIKVSKIITDTAIRTV
ncbi:hypothetical protein D3C78_1091020 [compost metagenome]